MKRYWLGIDPGGIVTMALVSPRGEWVAYADGAKLGSYKGGKGTNVPEAFVERIRIWQKQIKGAPMSVVIENVGPMPGEGIVSASKFAGSIWMARTACAALGIPYFMVTPTEWKKHFRLDKDKEKSRQKAMEMWPRRIHAIQRKMDHDRAEAALMARFGLDKGLKK